MACTRLRRDAHVLLLELAAILVGKTRPQRDDIAAAVHDHAVEIRRPVDQADDLEIGVAELQRARQRKCDRTDRCDRRLLRNHAVVRVQPDDVARFRR